MDYNRKIMRLELSAEKALNGGYYYAELLLPAADYEIKDAMQRTRAVGRENTVEVSIPECDILPELQDIRLDTFSLDELNFLAKRLASLPNEELPVFYAVTEQIFGDADENENPVSIKDLINCTYGLDTVPVAHNVSNLAELGRFAFENELLSDLDGIPESAVPFLNAEQIGRVQQKNDNGVFEGRLYIPTVHYDRPEIYDGVTLPDEESESSDFAICLLVSGTPEHIKGDPVDRAIWLSLPMASDILANYAAAFKFDSRWLENLLPRNEADKLLGRLGATLTDYGVISARNGHLFKPVPYDEPEAKELKTQALTEEKLDVIEVLDRRALFSNGRLMPEEIPEGLYAYDLRHSDDGDRFCAIEPKVGVNHGGTVLMRDILDFGESGYIPLDEDTEPNFLGDEMTPSEFAEEEAQDETMQMGGM